MFLNSKEDFRSLIIEEPEAHLHLSLQSSLARILVRLVNAGLPIWITTHGDSFFQQVSNLVKASGLNKKELAALGFDKSEVLDPQNVGAWQFVIQEGEAGQRKTMVQPLPIDEAGIASTAFNASISELVAQTLSLNKARESKE